ncbi:MAG: ImmA/IrrE family metallo-endopeptidase [Gammaproteobacteria bacterium]
MSEEPIDFQNIKSEAAKLLIKNGYITLNQFPVLIEEIAKTEGFTVQCFTASNKDKTNQVSGAISSHNPVILVNSRDNYERQRFTIAHELGHFKLHWNQQREFVDYRIPGVRNKKELEADEFAACLLMPEENFKKAWEYTKGNYEKLSKIFLVSFAAIGMRAFNLKLQ